MKIQNSKFKILNFFLNPIPYTLYPKKGFGLVEILIASAVLSASLIVLIATTQISLRLTKESLERTQAGFLAEEAVEAVRILRDTSWTSNIAPQTSETTYYLNFATTTNVWSLGTTSSLVYGMFTRTVTLSDVYRKDSDSEIVASTSVDTKTLDPQTKKIKAQVEWGARSVVLETYIADLFSN